MKEKNIQQNILLKIGGFSDEILKKERELIEKKESNLSLKERVYLMMYLDANA